MSGRRRCQLEEGLKVVSVDKPLHEGITYGVNKRKIAGSATRAWSRAALGRARAKSYRRASRGDKRMVEWQTPALIGARRFGVTLHGVTVPSQERYVGREPHPLPSGGFRSSSIFASRDTALDSPSLFARKSARIASRLFCCCLSVAHISIQELLDAATLFLSPICALVPLPFAL